MPDFVLYWYSLIVAKWDGAFYFNANHYGYYILLGLGILFSLYWLIKNKSSTLMFILITFLSYFYFFIFHFSGPVMRRYAFVTHVWTIALVAVAVYLLFVFYFPKKGLTKKIATGSVLILFFLTVFNPNNIGRVIDHSDYYQWENAYAPATFEHHDRFIPLLEKIGDQIKPMDTLICSSCPPFFWYDILNVDQNNAYFYKPNHPDRFETAAGIMEANPEGWLILDIRRNRQIAQNFPQSDFDRGKIYAQYWGPMGDFDVYRWHTKE